MNAFIGVVFSFILCVSLNHAANGSQITFTATPPTIAPISTRSLTLTCSFDPSVTSSNDVGLVGRRRRDVTHTSSDVIKLVTSLVVMRKNGEHVASVTQVSPPTALTDQSSLTVTGNLTQGTIVLTWAYPDDREAGDYVCEVNAMTSLGHSAVTTQYPEVGVAQLSLEDLIHHTRDQEIKMAAENLKIQQLEKTVLQQAQHIARQNETNRQLENMIRTLELESRTKDVGLQHQLNNSRHIETGTLACRNSTAWVSDPQGRSINVVHKFSKPYSKPPTVYLAMYYLSADSDKSRLYYWLHVSHVDTQSFTMTCKRFAGASYNTIALIQANWISFPTEL